MSELDNIQILEARVALLERQMLSLRKASLLNFQAAIVASTGAIASLKGVKTESPKKLQKILDEMNQLLDNNIDPEGDA